MRFTRNISIIFLAALFPALATGQCFGPLVKQGLSLMQQKGPNGYHYKEAINKFIAARFCLDSREEPSLDSLIRLAQDAWVGELSRARDRAIAEKGEADSLRLMAEQALEDARAYAEVARQAAIGAEARRLALVADNEARAGHYQDALDLSFLSAQLAFLSSGTQSEGANSTFGQAVFHQKSEVVFNSPAPITHFQVLPGDGGLLMALEDGSLFWASLDGSKSRLLGTQNSPFRFLVLSADGRFALSCAGGPTAFLWELQSHSPPAVLEGHTGDILGACFSPNSGRALTWSRDRTARLWKTDGQLIATLSGHQGSIQEGAFSQDGSYILTRSSDRTARIWDASGSMLAILNKDGAYLHSACFSPDGATALTAGADSTASLWGLDGRLIQRFGPHRNVLKEARFTPVGQMLVCRPQENAMQAWYTNGKPLASLNPAKPPSGLLFHQGQMAFLAWSVEGAIQLWTPEGRCLLNLMSEHGHILEPKWSSDGAWVLASNENGDTQLWNQNGNLCLYATTTSPARLPACFSSDGRWIILARNGRQLLRCPMPNVVMQEMKHGPFMPLGRQQILSERFMIPRLIFEILEESYHKNP